MYYRITPLIFIICLLFARCENAAKKQTGLHPEGALVTQYRAFTQQLDTADVHSAALAMAQYGKLFAGAGKDSCDSAFVIMEGYYNRQCDALSRLLQKDTQHYAPLVAIDEWGITRELSGELKEFSEKLRENGYRAVLCAGKITVVQDWDMTAARVSRFVSPEVNEYIARMNKEAKESVKVHTQVAVSPEALVEKIIWRESFADTHAAFILQSEIKDSRRALLTSLMTGTDSVYFAAACIYLNRQYPASATNKIVSAFYKARQEHNASFANALLDRYYKQGYIYNVH